ncbi:hypothetical protein ACTFIR_003976 [Dictyostelium discoideum]
MKHWICNIGYETLENERLENESAAALIDKAGLANEVLFIIFLDVSYWDLQKTTPTNTTPPQPILPKTVPNRYSTTTRRLPRRKREKEKGCSSTIHAASSTTTTPTIHASPSTTYISSTTHAASPGSPTTHAAP